MCGIAGVIGGEWVGGAQRVTPMLASLAPRGPDGGGIHEGDGAVLGARRLSIIDLPGADQPLFSGDGSLVLVANAEIYNYVELRRELRARGHRLATAGDCEVILHLYEELGSGCVARLRGMFAFALLDAVRGRVLLARDRLGEKPLYYHQAAGRVVFASEVKALMRSGLVPRVVDRHAVRDYLHFQYVPEPWTLVEGVRQLPAGHLLTVGTKDGRTCERRYWRFETGRRCEHPVQLLGEELRSIGRLQARSDVPVGVALSGGIDSSAVAALVASNGSGAAFTVGYEGAPAIDERRAASRVAKELGLPLHQMELRPADIVGALDDLVDALDQPVADLAGFGYYWLARLAREHGVKVLFHGHGGDELFWGYQWVRRALPSLRGVDASQLDRHQFYAHSEAVRSAARLLPGVCTAEFNALRPRRLVEPEARPTKLAVRAVRLLADTYLRSNGVAQTERLSMSAGVEVRLPLLDHRFVELVVGALDRADCFGDPPKAMFRAAVSGLVPGFVQRRSKKPFFTPARRWHRELFVAYGKRLESGWLVRMGILTRSGAQRLAAGSCGVGSGTSLSFKALVLETWLRSFLDSDSATVARGTRGQP